LGLGQLIDVKPDETARLIATLRGPRGICHLSSAN
jgi:hypothetical protein